MICQILPIFNKVACTGRPFLAFVSVGEDGIISPIIEGLAYRNITNKQGVFYINEIKNQFIGRQLYAKGRLVTSTPQTRAVGNVLVNYPSKEYTQDNKSKVETSARIYE